MTRRLRLIMCLVSLALMSVHGPALAETQKFTGASVAYQGQPIDHCANIQNVNNCSEAGNFKAATEFCKATHWDGAVGRANWTPVDHGTALHWFGNSFVSDSSGGILDGVECYKGRADPTISISGGDLTYNSQPIDHCADIGGANDCTQAGNAAAATAFCNALSWNGAAGYADWNPSQGVGGKALHWNGSSFVSKPTGGTFDYVECFKVKRSN